MPTQIPGFDDITFYTIEEAAAKLNCTRQTIRNYLKSGKLAGYRFGNKVLLTNVTLSEAIEDYTPRPHQKGARY